jgi:hypothetical protein
MDLPTAAILSNDLLMLWIFIDILCIDHLINNQQYG